MHRTHLALVALLIAGCSKDPPTTPPAAEKPRSETDLARTTLTAAQRDSLEVRSEPVRVLPVRQHLKLNGWVIAAPGEEVIITAPVAGYVRFPDKPGDFPVAGRPVGAEQPLFTLEPVLSPVEYTQLQVTLVQLQTLRRGIEGELSKARDSATAARSEHKRLSQLVASKLRGEQDLEQATARLRHAESDLAAAEDKLRLFDGRAGGLDKDSTRPLKLTAPRAGTALAVHASPGQYVVAAAPLATVADLTKPWLRVPVAEEDLQRVAYKDDIEVLFGEGGARLKAKFVALVPRVDALRHTIDVLYDLGPALASAPKGKAPVLARDLMAATYMPLGEKKPETVIPSSAVLLDSFGGAWIYLEVSHDKTGSVYERRRVELGPQVAEGQVIRPPLRSQDRIVTSNAAALFSREFYRPPGPSSVPVEDDD